MTTLDKILYAIAIGLLPLVVMALSGKPHDAGLYNGLMMLGN